MATERISAILAFEIFNRILRVMSMVQDWKTYIVVEAWFGRSKNSAFWIEVGLASFKIVQILQNLKSSSFRSFVEHIFILADKLVDSQNSAVVLVVIFLVPQIIAKVFFLGVRNSCTYSFKLGEDLSLWKLVILLIQRDVRFPHFSLPIPHIVIIS